MPGVAGPLPAGVVHWFMADDVLGVLGEGAAVGEPGVSDLPNHGSNGLPLQWFGASYAPYYRLSTLNGLPAIEHRVGDRMILPDSSDLNPTGGDFTLAYVGTRVTAADGPIFYTSLAGYLWVTATTINIATRGGFTKTFTVATALNEVFSFIVTAHDNLDFTGEVYVTKSGVDIAPDDADPTQSYEASDMVFNTLGRSSSTEGATWGEFCLWHRVLTPVEVAKLATYFVVRYSL